MLSGANLVGSWRETESSKAVAEPPELSPTSWSLDWLFLCSTRSTLLAACASIVWRFLRLALGMKPVHKVRCVEEMKSGADSLAATKTPPGDALHFRPSSKINQRRFGPHKWPTRCGQRKTNNPTGTRAKVKQLPPLDDHSRVACI